MDSTSTAPAPEIAPAVELPPEDKWCTTCKHCGTNASRNSDTYKCFAPLNRYTVSLVDGSRIYDRPLCKDQRHGTRTAHEINFDFELPPVDIVTCGGDGRWWEQKPAAPDRQLASMGDEFELPPVDKTLLAAKLAAARKPKVKVATNLLQDLGL